MTTAMGREKEIKRDRDREREREIVNGLRIGVSGLHVYHIQKDWKDLTVFRIMIMSCP